MDDGARPLVVRVRGRRIVCVGGGPVAAAKLRPLTDAGADGVVIAPALSEAMAAAVGTGGLGWEQRGYRQGDLAGAFLAIAGTDEAAVNAAVARDAEAQRTWCVRVDDGAGAPGSAAIPAAVTRGALTIAVSTGGRAPAVSRVIRQEIAATYGPEYGDLVDLLGSLRADPQVQGHLARLDTDQRRAAWRAVLDTDILIHIRSGRPAIAREVATACLFSSSV